MAVIFLFKNCKKLCYNKLCQKLANFASFWHNLFMSTKLENLIKSWPLDYLTASTIAHWEPRIDARYSMVYRALKKGDLFQLKRGLYGLRKNANAFSLAPIIYGPSYVSLESALSFHQVIPEGIMSIMCVSPKRKKIYETPIGTYVYESVPIRNFYLGVQILNQIPMAMPWKAIADLIYIRNKKYSSLDVFDQDLRCDFDILHKNIKLLIILTKNYPSVRVRDQLKKILQWIKNNE